MKARTSVAALGVAMVAAGCVSPYSEAPLATNFPTSKQEKLQAAAHWNVIAKDVASQIVAGQSVQRPLYVAPGDKSAFDHAFANQLISALVANGQIVLKQPVGALSVETDTQVVSFAPNRPQYRYIHGTANALMAGVWALHVNEATAGAALFAAGGTADAYAWFHSEFATGETPQTEIIVTASVSDGNQYLSRSTSIYYVADSDKALYTGPAPVYRIKATGGE